MSKRSSVTYSRRNAEDGDNRSSAGTDTEEDMHHSSCKLKDLSLQGKKRGDKPYRNNQHTQKAFDMMNMLRKQNVMCDVVLCCDGVDVPAHKMILSVCSPYFYAMFTSFEESKADRITLQGIDGNALLLLIDYVYTAEILVTEENVQTLLPAANILQLTDVRDASCAFLQNQLHHSNCLGIRAFADLHGCHDLMRSAETFIEQHFVDVVESDEYLALSAAQVCQLVSSDFLSVTSEETVFEAVMRWVNFDLTNREDYLPHLIEHVRLPLLSQDYLIQNVEEDPLVKTSPQCKDYIIEAMKYHLLKGEQRLLYKTPRTKPRTPVSQPKILLVVGGQAPKALRSVEVYDFQEERWYQTSEMPFRRCREGLAVLNGLVYAIGGFNGSLRVRIVDIYDPTKDVWSSGANMEARRSTLGVGVLNGLIYSVGGFDGTTGLNTAECYDVKCNEWRMIAPMSTRRSSVGVGVLNGLLYAIGGYDGASRQCLNSVECYNSETDQWTTAADMMARRSGAGVGVLEGQLYAVGGHDGPLVRKSVECYNPETNTWTAVADMIMCRRNAGVVAKEGIMFVVGGDDGFSNLASVEMYDPKSNVWTMLPSSMNIGRSYAGVVIVDRPS
ncbi:hypothetical protein CHUAL_014002 [Chamberlinius hualienensis]